MADKIIIKKGLDLPIGGTAERRITDATYIANYAVKPTDFVGLTPRLLVSEGDHVSAGTPLFCEKQDERILFTSPVSGVVKAIVRGEKRRLLAVVVQTIPEDNSADASGLQLSTKELMLKSGLWTMLRQRPFGTVPSPDSMPKAIVVSCFDSAPFGVDYDFVLQGRENDFVKGLEMLATLTEGKIHVCFKEGHIPQSLQNGSPIGEQIKAHVVTGPHPAGNVGTLIARLCPINKGEQVWTMNPQDIATLGHLQNTGVYQPERVIAVAGPSARNPHYYRIRVGACVESLVGEQVFHGDYPDLTNQNSQIHPIRIISGNVLSGTQIERDSFLGAYDNLISLLPEGEYYDFMGWLMPGLKKYSFSRTFISGLLRMLGKIGLRGMEKAYTEARPYKFDTNVHGSVRPLVFTGNFEQVFPFDIYPLQLLKACIVGDLELMEKLGIYEVEPEDFALCEFIDTSKTDIQSIVREALEKLRKEAI